jgi:hypothetical protein
MLVVGMRSAEECYRKVRRDSAGVTPVVRRNARVELDREENRHSRAIPLSDARLSRRGPLCSPMPARWVLRGSCRSARIHPIAAARSPDWLKVKESGVRGDEAGGGGGLGHRALAMTKRETEHLAQVERRIAKFKDHIARQREAIKSAIQRGHPTEEATSMLKVLEASLRALDRHRQLILDRLEAGRR